MSWRVKIIDNELSKIVRTGRTRAKIHSRRSVILSDMVGRHVGVYTGRTYNEVLVTDEMVGLVYGEFSFTKALGKKIHRNNRLQIKKRKRLMASKQFKVRKKRTLKKQKRKGRQKDK